jgi:hypothetical protein
MDLLWKIFTKFARERRELDRRSQHPVDQGALLLGHSDSSWRALGVPDLLAYGNGCTCALAEALSAEDRLPHF